MTSPNGDGPRHLDPMTAEMKAIPQPPRHSRPDTGELRKQPARPVPLWAHEDGKLHAEPPPTKSTRQERREAGKRPWWKFWENW